MKINQVLRTHAPIAEYPTPSQLILWQWSLMEKIPLQQRRSRKAHRVLVANKSKNSQFETDSTEAASLNGHWLFEIRAFHSET